MRLPWWRRSVIVVVFCWLSQSWKLFILCFFFLFFCEDGQFLLSKRVFRSWLDEWGGQTQSQAHTTRLLFITRYSASTYPQPVTLRGRFGYSQKFTIFRFSKHIYQSFSYRFHAHMHMLMNASHMKIAKHFSKTANLHFVSPTKSHKQWNLQRDETNQWQVKSKPMSPKTACATSFSYAASHHRYGKLDTDALICNLFMC